ncbi:MAG: response regulator [Polyangiales bacterium]
MTSKAPNPAPKRPYVLLVEDEPELAAVLRDYLVHGGMEVTWLSDGAEGVPSVRARMPDLILLDLMLPNVGGLDLCRELRTWSDVPIVMVTALVDEIDRLLGIELGADDYICKPYSPREVVARVRAVLRRTLPRGPKEEATPGLAIDEERMEIRLHGQRLDLTPMEYRFLRLLALRPGRIYSRAQLLELLHDDPAASFDRSIDTHVKNVRRKMAALGADGPTIHSVYGVGYKLE